MRNRFLFAAIIVFWLTASPRTGLAVVSPQPGDTCTGGQTGNFVTNSGSLQQPGLFLVCDGSHWNLFLGFSTAALVGIGTATPNYALDVYGGSAGTPALNVTNPSSSSFVNAFQALAPNLTGGQQAYFSVGRNAASNNWASFGFTYAGNGSASNRFDVNFFGSSPLLSVLASGNVGIGNTSPGVLLDIGSAGTTLGTLRLEGNTSGYVQLQSAAAAGSWTMTLPAGAGASGNVLSTNGSGVTSWVSQGSTITLGTAASATNPQRSGEATTGFYSTGSNLVDVAAGGTQIVEWSSLGQNIVTGSLELAGNNGVWQDATNNNLVVGSTAAPSTISQTGGGNNGQEVTAIGVQALNANTTGWANTAVGYAALQLNTTGTSNTAMGLQALQKNTIGTGNSALGYSALQSNTTGTGNAALGDQALTANTTGINNTAVGTYALDSNTTGLDNTGIGQAALNALTTGTNNVGIGYLVGSATLSTGSYNILIGNDSSVDAAAAATNHSLNIGNLLQGDMSYSTATYNKTLYLQSTASGVDYLTVTGSAAASPGAVSLTATGADTDINLVLNSKGAGGIAIGSTTATAMLHITGTGNTVSGIRIENTASDFNDFIEYLDSNTFHFIANGPNFSFETNNGAGNVLSGSYRMVIANGGGVAIGSSSVTAGTSLDLGSNTNAMLLPVGTTTQRPTGVNGMLRYNSSNKGIESYANSIWSAIPLIAGIADKTVQAANVASTTLVTPTTNTYYRISCMAVVTRAATTSSTLPDCFVAYTDVDSNTAVTIVFASGNAGNLLGTTQTAGTWIIEAKSGVAVKYGTGNTTGYASSGATSMQYAAHFRLEQIQ